MATKAIPDVIKCGRFLNGGKPVLQEVQPSDITGQKFNLIPNDTGYWMCNNKVWLQPEDDNDQMCTSCNEGHSVIQPCKDGAHHSGLIHQMALEMSASAVEEQRPFKWMSYGTQVTAKRRRGCKRSPCNGYTGKPSSVHQGSSSNKGSRHPFLLQRTREDGGRRLQI